MKAALRLAASLSDNRIGAVVVFDHGITLEEARGLLDNMAGLDYDQTDVREFDPRGGFPVFYVP